MELYKNFLLISSHQQMLQIFVLKIYYFMWWKLNLMSTSFLFPLPFVPNFHYCLQFFLAKHNFRTHFIFWHSIYWRLTNNHNGFNFAMFVIYHFSTKFDPSWTLLLGWKHWNACTKFWINFLLGEIKASEFVLFGDIVKF